MILLDTDHLTVLEFVTQPRAVSLIALVNDALLLSNNLRDFSRVPGLKVASWLE